MREVGRFRVVSTSRIERGGQWTKGRFTPVRCRMRDTECKKSRCEFSVRLLCTPGPVRIIGKLSARTLMHSPELFNILLNYYSVLYISPFYFIPYLISCINVQLSFCVLYHSVLQISTHTHTIFIIYMLLSLSISNVVCKRQLPQQIPLEIPGFLLGK